MIEFRVNDPNQLSPEENAILYKVSFYNGLAQTCTDDHAKNYWLEKAEDCMQELFNLRNKPKKKS